jgi:hypothetical protein
MKLLRLRIALFKAGYHPDQPRVPAGSAIGGQWVGAGTADRIRVAVSAFDNPGLYYVDLDKEELRGGHPVTKHVGKGNNYLLDYQLVWHTEHPGVITQRKDHSTQSARPITKYRKHCGLIR